MSNEDQVVIKVHEVSKNFLLPHEKISSLKSGFVNVLRKTDKSANVQHALSDITFEIKKGEFFGIVGRNGSGKSTLLKILAEIYQPSSGRVGVTGKLVPFIELGVGFNPELTGRENVYLNGALLGFTRKQIEDMYKDIVSFAELEDFMDQKLKNYSSGMQVRLAFSVATRAKADILLVDEVLAVGDADFQRKCFDFFKKLKKQGTTVVFVTHDMASVREYCDRAILIDKSKIIASGSPDKVATRYQKLFQQDKESNDAKGDIDRWGDAKAVIESVEVLPKSVKDENKQLVLKIEAKANENLDAVVIGFTLKDSAGKAIMGTNSLLRKQQIKNIAKNEQVTTIWTIPNIFREGTYSFDVAVNHDNGIDVHDWWRDAIEFKVYSTNYSQYIVNPIMDVEIRR